MEQGHLERGTHENISTSNSFTSFLHANTLKKYVLKVRNQNMHLFKLMIKFIKEKCGVLVTRIYDFFKSYFPTVTIQDGHDFKSNVSSIY